MVAKFASPRSADEDDATVRQDRSGVARATACRTLVSRGRPSCTLGAAVECCAIYRALVGPPCLAAFWTCPRRMLSEDRVSCSCDWYVETCTARAARLRACAGRSCALCADSRVEAFAPASGGAICRSQPRFASASCAARVVSAPTVLAALGACVGTVTMRRAVLLGAAFPGLSPVRPRVRSSSSCDSVFRSPRTVREPSVRGPIGRTQRDAKRFRPPLALGGVAPPMVSVISAGPSGPPRPGRLPRPP